MPLDQLFTSKGINETPEDIAIRDRLLATPAKQQYVVWKEIADRRRHYYRSNNEVYFVSRGEWLFYKACKEKYFLRYLGRKDKKSEKALAEWNKKPIKVSFGFNTAPR